MLIKSRSEEDIVNVGHPLIDRKSVIIANKLNVDKNVYNRLYKRDTYEHYKINKFENSLLATNTKITHRFCSVPSLHSKYILLKNFSAKHHYNFSDHREP